MDMSTVGTGTMANRQSILAASGHGQSRVQNGVLGLGNDVASDRSLMPVPMEKRRAGTGISRQPTLDLIASARSRSNRDTNSIILMKTSLHN